ncbi:hypothetical protein SH528x_007295 [Novipirellula sp. SH528]|uniref:hypothetical protein n=1 Tax=Novipirellula sp. SH528 TaxID=3454466 RepID=UPI003F9F8C3A
MTSSLAGLSASVNKVGKKWIANRPPQSWFATRSQDVTPDQWADDYAYVTFLVPKRGATIRYPETSRRFGVNHAAVYSFLVNRGKTPGGVVRRFTVSGQAKMLRISRPTVKSVIDDLLFAGFIGVADLGSSFDITLKPLSDDLISYFEQKPVAQEVHPTEKKPRDAERYELQGDGFDDWRKSCKWLMPQSSCEEAITTAKLLGDCLLGFRDQIRMAKEQHEKNKLKGNVGRGNFGKYFVTRMKTRLEEKQRQEREFQAEQKRQEYFSSEDFRKKQADQEAIAAADPIHQDHEISKNSIADRVRMAPGAFNEVKAHDLVFKILRHCSNQFLSSDLPLDVQRERGDQLYRGVMRTALSGLNEFYLQEDRATPEMLKSQVDAAFVEKGVQPLFAKSASKEVANV